MGLGFSGFGVWGFGFRVPEPMFQLFMVCCQGFFGGLRLDSMSAPGFNDLGFAAYVLGFGLQGSLW